MSDHPAIISPGEQLRAFLNDLGLTTDAAADQLGVPPGLVADLIAGRERITPDLSRRLSDLFDQSPPFWSNLQTERNRRVEEAARRGAEWSTELNRRLAES